MTNRQKFFMNGILLTAVGLAVRSVSLVFNSFISKTVGALGMGLFTLVMTVYSFAVTFATSGISLTVTRLVSSAIGEGRKEEVRGILRSSVIYSLIFSSFATAVLFFGAEYFGVGVLLDERCVIPLRILSISLIPIALTSVFSGYFIGVKRVIKNAAVQVMAQVFKIFVTAALVLRFSKLGVSEGVTALVAGMTLTEIACFLVALIQYVIDKRRHLSGERSGENFSSVLGMAVPLAVSAYIRSALTTLEHILIPRRLRKGGLTSAEALSDYGILHGMALPMLLYPMAPLSSFAGLLVPEFAEASGAGNTERIDRIATEAINATMKYAVAATVFVMLFSEELGYVIYNSYDAGKYIFLMAPVMPIMFLDHVSDAMLKGIGEHVYSMWVNIADSFLSIILVWFLLPKLGIGGYALVIIIMEAFNFTLSVARLKKRVSIRIKPLRSVILPFLAAFASAEISRRIFVNMGAFTPPVLLFIKIVFALCAFTVCYLLFTKLAFFKRKSANGSALSRHC